MTEVKADALTSVLPNEVVADGAVGSTRKTADRPDHLTTDHLRGSIRTRAVFGALAGATSQGGQFVLTFAYSAILARLLAPHDFGLVAMGMVVATFLQVLKDAGLSTATIQRQDITNAQVSNLFWLNIGVGGVAMIGMAATAPLVAWFFRQPELLGISTVLSLGFLLEALSVQHTAILNRQMRFTVVSAIEFGCALASLAIGTVMAFTGWGYWSLVGATLTSSTVKMIAVWMASGWRPQRLARDVGTRPLVRFGADLTLVGVIYAVSRGCDNLLIGKFLGSDAVGLYSRATALLTRPLERLMAPAYTVIVPALSRLQNDPQRYRSAYIRVFEGLAILCFLLAGLLFPVASAVVRIVLGPQWEAAAPIFGALTLAFLSFPLAAATSWLYTSQGRGRDLLRTASIQAAIMVPAFVVGLPFGATGVAIAYSAVSLLAILPLTFYIGGRTGPVSARDLWVATTVHAPVFVSVLAVTWLSREWLGHSAPALVQLAVCVPAGAFAAGVTVLAFPKTRRAVTIFIRRLTDLLPGRQSAIPESQI